MTRLFRFLLILFALLCPGTLPAADETRVPDAFHTSNLPLPRFVSLQAKEVHVRSGPGLRYPIKWVYKKPGMPVEIILEYEVWRKIRDYDGQEGWVHQTLLSGSRSGIIRSAEGDNAKIPIPLYQKPRNTARQAANVEPGAIVELVQCLAGWCLVSAAGYEGWTERKFIWGIYESELFD